MSVVNKMLQDLEQRQSEPLQNSDYQPPAKSTSKPLLYGLILILVVALGYTLWSNYTQRNSANVPAVGQASNQAEDAQGSAKDTPLQAQPLEQQPVAAQQSVQPAIQSDDTAEQATEAAKPVQTESAEAASETADISEAPKPAPAEVTAPPAQNSFSVRQSAESRDPAQSLREEARVALQSGDQQQAIGALQQLLVLQPENQKARKKLAAVLFAENRQLQAASVLEKGLELHPDNADFRLMLARLRYQRGQQDSAYDLLNSAAVAADVYPDFVSFRAALAEQRQDFQQATADYSALIQADAENPRWWLGLAVSLDRAGDLVQAREAYGKVREYGPIDEQVSQFVSQRLEQLAGAR